MASLYIIQRKFYWVNIEMVQFILRGNLSHVCGMIFFLVDSNSILESKIGSTVWAKTWYLRPIQKYFQSHGGRCDQEGFEWDSLDEDEGWTQGQGGTIIELNWRSSHMYRCGQPDWKRNIWDWSSKILWYGYALTLRNCYKSSGQGWAGKAFWLPGTGREIEDHIPLLREGNGN